MITLLGPTASGKTSLAVALAAGCDAEIISADSRQVYRRMDIGTGKDLDEYRVNGRVIPYHLIDICEPGTQYNLFAYQRDFHRVYHDIRLRGKNAVLCGGTGLYIESVLKGFHLPDVPANPTLRGQLKDKTLADLTEMLRSYKTLHNTTEVDTVNRAVRAIEIEVYLQDHPQETSRYAPLNSLTIGLMLDRDVRRRRITERLHERLRAGMVDEIQALLDSGIPAENLLYYGLEYRFVTRYLLGELSYSDMVSQLETGIHQFAKRQMTWFRGMEKRGLPIHWLDALAPRSEQLEQIRTWMESGNA
ncbi:MAG: tRNA (adenosine(37)-N6)-dimethylallyltransferase MiaA [Paludibacteraceae bacterium]|nr:tRNA (adenosine(37)-N6)-dimethylallyltransferase MiaA [Paludibacteraceae bacterium]